MFQCLGGVLQLLQGAEESLDLVPVVPTAAGVDLKVAGQPDGLRAGHHELQQSLTLLQEVCVEAGIFGDTEVRAEALEDELEARPAGRAVEAAVVGSARLEEEAQESKVVLEVAEAEMGEGFGGRALAGVGPVGQQQLGDAEAEAICHPRLLRAAAHPLAQQEDEGGEDGVAVLGGGPDVCT